MPGQAQAKTKRRNVVPLTLPTALTPYSAPRHLHQHGVRARAQHCRPTGFMWPPQGRTASTSMECAPRAPSTSSRVNGH